MSEVEPRERVLQACRGLAAYGLGPNIGGHVSVRVPGHDRYWTHALDRSFVVDGELVVPSLVSRPTTEGVSHG